MAITTTPRPRRGPDDHAPPPRVTTRPAKPPLGWLAFACVAPALALETLNAVRLTHSVSVGDALLVVGGILAVLPRIRRGILAGSIPPWLWLGGTGLIIAGLLAAFRSGLGHDLLPTLEFAGTLIGVPVIVMLVVDSYGRLELAVELWLLVASLSAVIAVLDLKLGAGIGSRLTGIDYVRYGARAPGLTLQPNFLGLASAMAMPVAALRASRRGRWATFDLANVRNLLYLMILGAGVLASGSRSALVAAVIAIAALPFFLPGRRRSIALLATGILVVVALGVLTFDSSIASKLGVVTGQRFFGPTGQGSTQYRLVAYAAAIRETIAHPLLGQGFQSVLVAHDIYLQLLQAGGVVALLAFLTFAGGAVATARRLTTSAELPAWVSGLAAAFGASLAAWLIGGLALNDLYNRYLYIPVGFLLATRVIPREQAVSADGGAVRPPATVENRAVLARR